MASSTRVYLDTPAGRDAVIAAMHEAELFTVAAVWSGCTPPRFHSLLKRTKPSFKEKRFRTIYYRGDLVIVRVR